MEPIQEPSISPEMFQQIYKKTNGHCAYCGSEIKHKGMIVSHIVPISLGGSDDLDNLLPSCRTCFQLKGSLMLLQFKQAIWEAMKKNKALSRRYVGLVSYKNIHSSDNLAIIITLYFESHSMLAARQKSLQEKKSKRLNKRDKIYEKTNGRCAYCGRRLSITMSIDHVIPQARDGSGRNENLLATCGYCNTLKGDLTLEEYRESVKKAISEGTHEQHRNIMSFQSKGSNTLKFYFEYLSIYVPKDISETTLQWQEKGPLCDLSSFMGGNIPASLEQEAGVRETVFTSFKNALTKIVLGAIAPLNSLLKILKRKIL